MAFLRVGTGQKALRAVGGRFFLNCEKAREKLTGRNTPPAIRKTKGLRNSREEPAHPRWRKEAGEGKRANSPREATPSHPTNRPRVLSEDSLSETRPAARAGAAEGKGAPHLGKERPSLCLPEPLRPGKAQNAGATESALLWSTRKLEPHSTQGPLHTEQPGA